MNSDIVISVLPQDKKEVETLLRRLGLFNRHSPDSYTPEHLKCVIQLNRRIFQFRIQPLSDKTLLTSSQLLTYLKSDRLNTDKNVQRLRKFLLENKSWRIFKQAIKARRRCLADSHNCLLLPFKLHLLFLCNNSDTKKEPINYAFIWGDTPQGSEFWGRLNDAFVENFYSDKED